MRHFTVEEVYDYFLKNDYQTKETMISTFNTQRYRDKERKYKNKKYICLVKNGYYLEEDIKEFLNFRIEEYNTVLYAQQLIIDLVAIFDYLELKLKRKLANLLNTTPTRIGTLDFGYEASLKIIKILKDRLMQMSPEAREELRMIFDKVKE